MVQASRPAVPGLSEFGWYWFIVKGDVCRHEIHGKESAWVNT